MVVLFGPITQLLRSTFYVPGIERAQELINNKTFLCGRNTVFVHEGVGSVCHKTQGGFFSKTVLNVESFYLCRSNCALNFTSMWTHKLCKWTQYSICDCQPAVFRQRTWKWKNTTRIVAVIKCSKQTIIACLLVRSDVEFLIWATPHAWLNSFFL